MKKINLKSIFVLATIILLSAFTYQELKLGSAEVDQVQGIYVFYRSKPAKAYDYLGTVKSPGIIKTWKGSYLVDLMVKRAKEKHPTCNGIIFKDEDMTEVDAVLIK